ncbi:MAG: hypothetical protein IPH08_01480 [Rhodocyclaceae bacterium]|nr:hypothetical protein [Rhodocyclaceae bacterium]
MTWTTPADLRHQVLRLWERGELLRASVSDDIVWPLRLSLKTPTATELADQFEAVRTWAAGMARPAHLRIEHSERRHRVHGTQRLPATAWVDGLDEALALVGKTRDVQRFRRQWQQTAEALPFVLPWLRRRPLAGLELADDWPRLLAVVKWLMAHPRPATYLRQVDVPGVDSKFIEAHRGVLTELVDLALPPEAIDTSATGVAAFARRYGFREKPMRVRFRTLDDRLQPLPCAPASADITLDADSFGRLHLPIERVFIIENETNFLAFPPVTGTLAIFGAGYGWEALAKAQWLTRCTVHYWGDIDTHGFAILDQLRQPFPHAESFLMDRATLEAHRAFWDVENTPTHSELTRLTPDEQALYDDLRSNRIREGLRLEQERIRFSWLTGRLHDLLTPSN